MNLEDKLKLVERLKTALQAFEAKATPEQVEAVHKTLRRHSDALFENADLDTVKSSEFSLVKPLLEDTDEEKAAELKSRLAGSGFSQLLARIEAAVKKTLGMAELVFHPRVLPDGAIFGDGKYEILDLGWIEAFIAWLDNYFTPREFPQPGVWLNRLGEGDRRASLALFGDWGGGCWSGHNAAQAISGHIQALNPDYLIHLGDVYYAGRPEEERLYLLDYWPATNGTSFTLNSNHEMYSAGKGYFDLTLADPRFATQNGKSFFALEFPDWIVVGLDSAFAADQDSFYLQGRLNQVQQDFLRQVQAKGKKTIVLSHHNPIPEIGVADGTEPGSELWAQVRASLGDSLRYWYWGHVHAGAVYQDIGKVKCRVAGHGVVPWGNAKSLQNSLGKTVVWYERTAPIPPDGVRVQNGFVLLKLDGPDLEEAFLGEDGAVHWHLP